MSAVVHMRATLGVPAKLSAVVDANLVHGSREPRSSDKPHFVLVP